jgi:hypothetical protein
VRAVGVLQEASGILRQGQRIEIRSGNLPGGEVSTGMVVSAEIITGAKSFAPYLLKPVYKTFGSAFSEK